MNSELDQAVHFLIDKTIKAPSSADVVEALLAVEKTSKQSKIRYKYEQLLGTWRLGFITGTKKSQKRAGVILGAGRFIPALVKIQISYTQSSTNLAEGTVQNLVEFGLLKLVVTGPTKFWQNTNILGFDFTQIQINFAGVQLYSGYIRGGQRKEEQFYKKQLKDQAFFNYFLIENDYIAARGRGGGLAIWTRVK